MDLGREKIFYFFAFSNRPWIVLKINLRSLLGTSSKNTFFTFTTMCTKQNGLVVIFSRWWSSRVSAITISIPMRGMFFLILIALLSHNLWILGSVWHPIGFSSLAIKIMLVFYLPILSNVSLIYQLSFYTYTKL